MYSVRAVMASFLLFFVSCLHAATDPVAWSLFPATGFAPTPVGSPSQVVYTLTNKLPRPAKLDTTVATTSGNFHTLDLCHNQIIAPNASCHIFISYAPASAGNATIQLTYGYHNNRISLPTLTATATGQGTEQVEGTITGLPSAFTLSNPEQRPIFSVTYTNVGTTDVVGYAGNTGGTNLLTATPASVATVAVLPGSTCGVNGAPVTLKQGNSCTLMGQLTPVGLGQVNVAGLFTYDGDTKTATPSATSTVINGGSTCLVHGHVSLPLPINTYKYADNVVQFTFENECTTDSATLGPVTFTSNLSPAATITTNPTYDLCSNTTLAPNTSCTVTASVIPNGTGNLAVKASVTSSNKATATTGSTVATNQQTKHHILFINQCKFPVWYGIANGGDKDCPGTGCQTKDPNLVANPTGAPTSDYFLTAQVSGLAPATIDLAFDSYTNGAIWPRTGCTMQSGQFNCATGTCQTKDSSGTCFSPQDAGSGPVQPQSPFTKVEGFFANAFGGDGIYDVSLINGMTVPVEMKAFGPSTGNTASTVYNCSAVGALIQPQANNALGNCSWNFNPESTIPIASINSDFYWVLPGADSACADGVNCGMSYSAYPQNNGNSPGPINRREGDFLGFNPLLNDTAFVAPAQWGSKNLFTHYGMDIQIPGQTTSINYGTTLVSGVSIVLPGNTYPAYDALLSIPGITNNGSLNSCYQIANTFFAHCGGCINWTNTLPAAACGFGSPNYTDGQNLDWTTNPIAAPVGGYTPLQGIEWIKNACPTAYSYQFDDQTSSFQCTKDGSTSLLTSYQVTLCPGGVDGLPSGATDGRNTGP